MKLLATLLLVSLLTACLQTENSSSQDDSFANVEGSAEFLAAKAVLTQNCASCHTYHTRTEQELIDLGLVIAGSAETSELYGRLQNSSGSLGPKDMPENNSISVEDVETIKIWIDGI